MIFCCKLNVSYISIEVQHMEGTQRFGGGRQGAEEGGREEEDSTAGS